MLFICFYYLSIFPFYFTLLYFILFLCLYIYIYIYNSFILIILIFTFFFFLNFAEKSKPCRPPCRPPLADTIKPPPPFTAANQPLHFHKSRANQNSTTPSPWTRAHIQTIHHFQISQIHHGFAAPSQPSSPPCSCNFASHQSIHHHNNITHPLPEA